jgi:magnesium chelatase accessory protein
VPDTADQLLPLPTNWPNREHSSFVTAAGLRWHVQRAGQGPAILLLHGTAGATHTWRHILPTLASVTDVIAIDLPGHGFTTGATADQLSLTGMTSAVADLLRVLEVQPSIGVGHSAGAAIGLQLTSLPDLAPRSLVSVNSALVSINALGQMLLPVSRAAFDLPLVRDLVAATMLSGTIARALLRSTGTELDAEQAERYVSLLTDETRVGMVLRMMARWDLPALHARFPSIAQPVTLVHSRNEPWVPFDELLAVTASLPRRTVIDVTPAGHLIPDEKPQAVADIILAELARLTTAER